jgi:Rad3-related DNA helicase
MRKQWADSKTPAFCVNDHPKELLPPLLDFAAECDGYLEKEPSDSHMEVILNLYFSVLDYLRVSELYDERYAFFCEPASGFIRLYCLDPSALLAAEQKKSRAGVFFSATLTPLPYFRNVLGGEPADFTLRLASPFRRENLCLLVDDRISTRYKDRAGSYEKIAARLYEMVTAQTGNYMAFFPSYAYLSEVYTAFTDRYPHIPTKVQRSEMDEESREAFLADFKETSTEGASDTALHRVAGCPIEPLGQPTNSSLHRVAGCLQPTNSSLLAFVVLGGVFSEGIDLKGTRLIGAAVVSVGLPMISEERNVIKDYYNRYSDDGFAFAYIFPGMNKVMQAAGRVIRTETDRGTVLLIDSRFTETAYRSLFPPEWAHYVRLKSVNELSTVLADFWADKNICASEKDNWKPAQFIHTAEDVKRVIPSKALRQNSV